MRSRSLRCSPRFACLYFTAVVSGVGSSCSDEDSTTTRIDALDPVAPVTPDAGGVPMDAAPPPAPGALVRVTATSRVGVLLDEIPSSVRERAAADLLARDEAFWLARAHRQLLLATYRLNFRNFFYDEADGKRQLPLPPESIWTIALGGPEGGAARRATVEGHDYVLIDYSLDTLLVTDADSPGVSEPALAAVGGAWSEPFTFPVDPELVLQRTGYACMDEAEFPPNSVDSENVEFSHPWRVC